MYQDNLEARTSELDSLKTELEAKLCNKCREKLKMKPKEEKKIQNVEKNEEVKPAPIKKLRLVMLIAFWSAVYTAIIWSILSLFGNVPIVYEIKFIKNIIWQLPFGISRWWDILFAVPYGALIASVSIYLIPYLAKKYSIDKDDLNAGLGTVLIIGLVTGIGVGVGLGVGLVSGLGVGLGVGLIAGIGVGLVSGLGVGLGVGLIAGIGVGLVSGLGVGLVSGLGVGLGAELAYVLGIGLSIGLVWVTKQIIKIIKPIIWVIIWTIKQIIKINKKIIDVK